jgi:hypothetical protein
MKNLKTIFASLLIIIIHQTNLSAAEVGTKHEYGLSFLGSYEYEEPKLMHLRSGSQAADDELENLGFLYNYKNAFINDGGFLNEFEFDSSYQFLTQTYWSNGTGTMKDIDVEIYNLRALYGIQLSDKLMLKSGIGYRHLYHYWQNRQSTSGAWGYDREQDYTYIPIIAELKMPIPELNLDGKLKVEFDQIIEGNNTSYLGYLGGANRDLSFKNSDGYAWKVAYEGKRNGFIFEPYYEFMHVDDSNLVSSSHEPANTTKEIGLRVKKEFNSNRSVATDFKEVLGNDDFYFGVQLLRSEVETGMYALTGTAKIDEKDYGYSIVSGMRVLDEINGKPIKLDVELAYNQFGEAVQSCNNGDTTKTDGRYRNGLYSAGTTLTCSQDNNDVIIESYSTTLGIKPSIDLSNGIFVSANLGLNRWNQSEHDVIAGTNNAGTNYDGIDTYMGFGIGLNKGNLNLGLDYLEHDMYYDAKSISASLKYNF